MLIVSLTLSGCSLCLLLSTISRGVLRWRSVWLSTFGAVSSSLGRRLRRWRGCRLISRRGHNLKTRLNLKVRFVCRLYWAVAEYRNVCYLIHFDEPIGNAQHYLGYASDLSVRTSQHRSGHGARLTGRANFLGIGWRVVRVWRNGSPAIERRLKSMGAADLCPHCSRYIRNLPPVTVEKGQGQPSLT